MLRYLNVSIDDDILLDKGLPLLVLGITEHFFFNLYLLNLDLQKRNGIAPTKFTIFLPLLDTYNIMKPNRIQRTADACATAVLKSCQGDALNVLLHYSPWTST